ncbi:MAG TPA: hypothetical protein VLR71_16310 [Casimicrobiaceae bacterium]|nr:hypothetical protein [Casimicrobiaceae bacterium]
MTSSTYLRTPKTAVARPSATPADPAGRSHLADYVVDVFFIALLAAPFVIFQSPATMQEAATGHATVTQAVVSSAAAEPVAGAANAGSGDSAYGPE